MPISHFNCHRARLSLFLISSNLKQHLATRRRKLSLNPPNWIILARVWHLSVASIVNFALFWNWSSPSIHLLMVPFCLRSLIPFLNTTTRFTNAKLEFSKQELFELKGHISVANKRPSCFGQNIRIFNWGRSSTIKFLRLSTIFEKSSTISPFYFFWTVSTTN